MLAKLRFPAARYKTPSLLVKTPLNVLLLDSPVTVHPALGVNLATSAKLVNQRVNDVDNVLCADNVIHGRTADTTEPRIFAATTKHSNQPTSTRYISTISIENVSI